MEGASALEEIRHLDGQPQEQVITRLERELNSTRGSVEQLLLRRELATKFPGRYPASWSMN